MAYTEKNQEEKQVLDDLVKIEAKLNLQSGFTMEELEQYGREGLEIAKQKYTPNCKFKFVPYAVYFIRQNIKLNIEQKKERE